MSRGQALFLRCRLFLFVETQILSRLQETPRFSVISDFSDCAGDTPHFRAGVLGHSSSMD